MLTGNEYTKALEDHLVGQGKMKPVILSARFEAEAMIFVDDVAEREAL